MGGGSSVMGMVALRGTPDDYAEWESLGATGWGWNDVLPFFRKLENDFDFAGDLHGKDGPVPIRRTHERGLAAAVARRCIAYAQERQIPFLADMNGGFPRRLRRRADEQLAGQARVGGDLLSRCVGARARAISPSSTARTSPSFCSMAGAPPASTARVGGEDKHVSARARSSARSAASIRRHFLMRDGHRPGRASARARHRGARRHAGRRAEPVQPCDPVRRHCIRSRGARQAESLRPHPMTCFRYSSGLPGAPRTDMYINVQMQDVLEPARACRSPTSRRRCSSRWRAAAWR